MANRLTCSLAPVLANESRRQFGDELLVVVQRGDVVGVLQPDHLLVLAAEPLQDVRAVGRGDDVVLGGLENQRRTGYGGQEVVGDAHDSHERRQRRHRHLRVDELLDPSGLYVRAHARQGRRGLRVEDNAREVGVVYEHARVYGDDAFYEVGADTGEVQGEHAAHREAGEEDVVAVALETGEVLIDGADPIEGAGPRVVLHRGPVPRQTRPGDREALRRQGLAQRTHALRRPGEAVRDEYARLVSLHAEGLRPGHYRLFHPAPPIVRFP